MKLIIGIVRPEKANDVLEALYRAEVRGVSMSRVQGHGGELDRVETYRGTRVKMELAEKVRFEIAVSDDFVEPTIQALCEGGADRRGRRRQDLRHGARAGGADPHGRDRPRGRDAGRPMSTLLAARAVDPGDTAWMLVATALVLMMTPALGLFYAGLVRSKNMLNTFMMSVGALGVVTVALGAGRLLAGLRHRQRLRRRAALRVPAARRLRAARRGRRSRTCCSWPTGRRSASSPPRWCPGPWSSGCATATFLVFMVLWSVLVYPVLAH